MTKLIILIHGLNNTIESFDPLADLLRNGQYQVRLISLPGHQKTRSELDNLSTFMKIFDERMKQVIKEEQEYFLIAFSAGALFFSLWLRNHPNLAPKKLIFLAPAFYIKNQILVNFLTKRSPQKLKIPAQTPKPFRRFNYLYINEYRVLIDAINKYQNEKPTIHLPSLIIIDPKDELINVSKTMTHEDPTTKTYLIKRKYLKWKKPGKYHILFDPGYFSPYDWEQLGLKIKEFLD